MCNIMVCVVYYVQFHLSLFCLCKLNAVVLHTLLSLLTQNDQFVFLAKNY